MKSKSLRLIGAASAALMLTVPPAQAAASSNSSSTASSTAIADTNQRIDDVNARLDALEAELQGAETRAAADHDATASTASSILGAWWSNTNISGRMYFDASYIDQTTNGVRSGASNGTALDIKRFYIGIDHKFDDVFSANVTTDFTFDSGSGVNQIYIKKAYLQAKVSDALVFKLGSTDMPWIPFVEDIYGYRYVENTTVDRLKLGNSADWGAHVSGKLPLMDGATLSYALSVVNGAGYKKANLFRTNGPDVEGRVNVNYGDYVIGVGGYVGKLGVQFGGAEHHEASRFDAIAAWTPKDIRIGVETFITDNFASVGSTTQRDQDTGVSGFASWTFMPQWSVFGRYDFTERDILTLPATRHLTPDDYFNVGLEWNPVKIVDLSLVYKHENLSGGQIATASSGTIGGTALTVGRGAYNEVGLFGQLRW